MLSQRGEGIVTGSSIGLQSMNPGQQPYAPAQGVWVAGFIVYLETLMCNLFDSRLADWYTVKVNRAL
jgi:hypothetical protein